MEDIPQEGREKENSAEAAEVEFWATSEDLVGRVFAAYSGSKEFDFRFSEYAALVRDGYMPPLNPESRNFKDFIALRGIVETLKFLFQKYKTERRQVSGKLSLRHPVRVMDVLSQVSVDLPEMWKDLQKTSGSEVGRRQELQQIKMASGHPLRLWVAAMLHDVAEEFFDGDFEAAEPELRVLLEKVFEPIPEATSEDVESVLKTLRYLTKPETRYSSEVDKNSLQGLNQYVSEYAPYLAEIEAAVERGELEGCFAVMIKEIDVLHNGSTEKINSNKVKRLKKQEKARLAGQYILSHFPRLRWVATRSAALQDLLEKIQQKNPYLWTEIQKLPEPPDDWTRRSVDEVISS